MRVHTPANLFQEEPNMFEDIKLETHKTFKRSRRPKRLNRVKEITKRPQTSNEKIEDEFTEFANTRKDRTSTPHEIPKPDEEPNIRSKQKDKQDENKPSSSRKNNKYDGGPKTDDQDKNVASIHTPGYYSTANEWKITKRHLRNAIN